MEAQTCAEQKRIQLRNEGQTSFANEELAEFGKTVQNAIDFYLTHLRRQKRAIPLADAIAELLEVKRTGGKSPLYIYSVKLRLSRFETSNPEASVADFTPKDCDEWLSGLHVAPGTQNTHRRDLQTLFSFCVKRGYLEKNPAAATERVKDIAKPPEIFKPKELAALLEHCGDELLPYFAIGAFAGLRAAEIERLTWDEIDFEHRLINVAAEKSKTSRRRLVKIENNLFAWIQPLAQRTGKVAPANLRKRVLKARACAGLTHWPQNGLRHSFGSYWLAKREDAAALALQMGNSPQMIFAHYRELVKPRDAERYWSIAPVAS